MLYTTTTNRTVAEIVDDTNGIMVDDTTNVRMVENTTNVTMVDDHNVTTKEMEIANTRVTETDGTPPIEGREEVN